MAEDSTSLTRRAFLGRSAAVGAGAVLASVGPPPARAQRRPGRPRTVAVLGGGIAGLTAAHELAERGFRVTVYERRALGGKARSFGVPGSAAAGRRPLPGEHGFRLFLGNYVNLPDTMRRIPFGSDPQGTFGNVVSASQAAFLRAGSGDDLVVPFAPVPALDPHPWTLEAFRAALGAMLTAQGADGPEADAFVQRLLVYFSSCDERRLAEWERVSWWDFVRADQLSERSRGPLVSTTTRFLLAADPRRASARTLGSVWQGLLYGLLGRGVTENWDRVLDAPTNEAFIDPWVAHLRRLGVRFRVGTEVTGLEVERGRIAGARARAHGRRATIEADWYVCALPVERVRGLLTPQLVSADAGLRRLARLTTRPMHGIQFFLRRPTPVVRGHVVHLDSPWALSSVSQVQFWTGRDFARDYGDGSARDCLSVIISDFDTPGVLYRRPASELRPRQVAREVWEQLKRHVDEPLAEDLVASWVLDPGLIATRDRRGRPRLVSEAGLLINTPGSWRLRPEAATAIPNLFLAADYVRTGIDAASMEGANEAGRRAAGALLQRAASREEPVHLHALYQPPEWIPYRRLDEELLRRGRPNVFDRPAAAEAA